jgi:hypothetical protein
MLVRLVQTRKQVSMQLCCTLVYSYALNVVLPYQLRHRHHGAHDLLSGPQQQRPEEQRVHQLVQLRGAAAAHGSMSGSSSRGACPTSLAEQ